MMTTREKKIVKLAEMFPNMTMRFSDEDTYTVFAEKHALTPRINPHYSYPENETIELLTVLEKESRHNIWVSGPSGAGKSSLARNLGSLLNAIVYEFYGDAHKKPVDLFGRQWLTPDKVLTFRYGIVPKWLRTGGILIIHEYDHLDPEVVNVLKPVLEYPRRVTLVENDDEVIEGHPDCRLIVTCNTQGRGDDTGMFVGAHVHSIADLRRFDAFIEVDYIGKDQEIAMLASMFPDVPKKTIENIVAVANKTRDAFKRGNLGRVLSTAECINWVENYRLFATAHHAARISFLNAYEDEARMAVKDMITAAFGTEDAEMLADTATAARAADKSTDETEIGA